MFHFFDRLTSPSYEASCSSLDWGFAPGGPCSARITSADYPALRNTHTWDSARAKAQNPGGEGWLELGYVLHLLEDLTSPAHVRNDPHPPFAILGEADPLEALTRVPDIPLPGQSLIPFVLPQQAFRTLQAWVQANFFSRDSTFQYEPYLQFGEAALGGPRVLDGSRGEDADYFYGPCLTTPLTKPPGFDSWVDPACHDDRRKIAAKGERFRSREKAYPGAPENRRWAEIDDVIADEQFMELGPVIMLYTASLIRHYYEVASPTVEACPAPSGIDDNFNDNFLNPSLWQLYAIPDANAGTVVETNQRLEVALNPGVANVGVRTKCSLAGDFDVQVDFILLNWSSDNHQGLSLGAVDLGQGTFGVNQVLRFSESGGGFYVIVYRGNHEADWGGRRTGIHSRA